MNLIKNKILLINGPNLNLLGIREPNKYGHLNLKDILLNLEIKSKLMNLILINFQYNSESKIIECIQNSKNENIDFIIINAGAFSHTSIAIRDALLSINIPFIEIHITNIYSREPFRRFSYLSDIAIGSICGLGVDGYYFALKFAKNFLLKQI